MVNEVINVFCYVSGLAHCRHLKTVRTHLSGLVNGKMVPPNIPYDAVNGLTKELWQELNSNGVVSSQF